MKRFRRLGVFLCESPGDDEALSYAARFATLADSEFILCIHVRGGAEEPKGEDPQLEEFRQRIRQQLPAELKQRARFEVHRGSGIPEVLRSARDAELDLIVIGRRLPSDQLGAGGVFTRLARKSPCDVLVVPNHARPRLGRLLVPVDLSEHARVALETAIAIAKGSGDPAAQVLVQTIFSVGYGHQYTGLDVRDAAHQLESVTCEKLDAFLADVDSAGVSLERVSSCSEQLDAATRDLAAVRQMDMIVVGSRGATFPAVALLGSTAERILVGSPLPVLIVKKKGETTHLLDALLGA